VALPTVTPSPQPAQFDPVQTTLALRTVVEGLDRPLFATHAGDGSGRLFIVEKGGTIRLLSDGQLQSQPFLDITDRVNSSGNEQGLLGLAFAPDYAQSGFFFVNYSDAAGHTNIARFQVTGADPNLADPASEFQVLLIEQPARNHNGGMVAFGPDGYLWIGMGDGGASFDRFGNGQNPATLLGKMLRLDVTSDPAQPYTIPADNPWVEADWNGIDVRDEVWAVGLRNPWRYSFDRQTGDLWIGDVGQNQYEEINLTPAGSPGGLNYGWPLAEGLHCLNGDGCDQAELTPPVLEYDHSGHCSVTGGYVYRGRQFPTLQGVYLYGDYCSGVIWATWPDAQGQRAVEQVLDTNVTLSSFGEDEAGELYVTDLSGGVLAQVVVE
jgi:glucose/arabinose dehydrogenase